MNINFFSTGDLRFPDSRARIGWVVKVWFLMIVGLGWLFPYQPTLRSSEIFSVRSLGMGWAYTAIANDEAVLHANPAGIGVRRKFFQVKNEDPLFYFFPIKFGYSENIFSSLILQEGIQKYTALNTNKLSYGVEFNSPTDFVYAGDFWAISFISRGLVNIFNDLGFEDGYYQARIFSQIKAGFKLYSFSILSHQDFHIAMSGKVMYLLHGEKNLPNTELNKKVDLLGTTATPQQAISTYAELFNFFEGVTFGVDFGVLWEIHIGDSDHQINLGIMVEDAPTYALSFKLATDSILQQLYPILCGSRIDPNGPHADCVYQESFFGGAESTFFKVNGKVGIAYMLPHYWGGFFSDTIFAFDVHRIGDFEYNFAEMYHVGVSTTIFDMVDTRTGYSYRLNLSLGVSQNQFNAGYLVHLNAYQIGYNYYREKTMGFDRVVQRHIFTFAFYF